MAEFIEREAFLAEIEKRYCKPCEAEGKDYNHVRCRACWVDDMMGEIGDAPFYDVSPVVHGRWAEKERIMYDSMREEDVYWFTYVCSVCNGEVMNNTNYCPNCGARMDGDK